MGGNVKNYYWTEKRYMRIIYNQPNNSGILNI